MLPFLLPRPISGLKPALYPSASVLTALYRVRQPPSGFALSPSCSRQYARNAEEEGDEEIEEGDEIETARTGGEHLGWLQTAGAVFRRPKEDGPNWLGGTVPFPMNPSFKPPPPISDKIRTQIFNLYVNGTSNEQQLSAKFGLSPSRIKAILRLKKLEQLWADMERYLGVQTSSHKSRELAEQIDIDVDTHAIGSSNKLQRVFYELVPEGQRPPLAHFMDLAEAMSEEGNSATGTNKRKAARAKDLVVAPALMRDAKGKLFESATKYKWFYPARPGRPPYTFVDVGDRYRKAASPSSSKPDGTKLAKDVAKFKDKLALAQEDLQQKRARLEIDEKVAKQESIKLKRKKLVQRELALASAKVGRVDIKL
ncbi:hypothetical protein FRC17_010013 [Serendipita sp. 399]|nr:hypothetical protein FRC17_010013 [Serendipita sp. 399]